MQGLKKGNHMKAFHSSTTGFTATLLLSVCAFAVSVGTVRAEDKAKADTDTRSRAEVVAETVAASQAGELDADYGEDSGSFRLSRQLSQRAPGTRPRPSLALRWDPAVIDYTGEDSGSFALSRTWQPASGARRVALR